MVLAYLHWMPEGIELPINIRSGFWIGTNVTFMLRITFGDRCIVGANAVLLRGTDQNEIWFSVPAKRIRNVESVNKELELSS